MHRYYHWQGYLGGGDWSQLAQFSRWYNNFDTEEVFYSIDVTFSMLAYQLLVCEYACYPEAVPVDWGIQRLDLPSLPLTLVPLDVIVHGIICKKYNTLITESKFCSYIYCCSLAKFDMLEPFNVKTNLDLLTVLSDHETAAPTQPYPPDIQLFSSHILLRPFLQIINKNCTSHVLWKPGNGEV